MSDAMSTDPTSNQRLPENVSQNKNQLNDITERIDSIPKQGTSVVAPNLSEPNLNIQHTGTKPNESSTVSNQSFLPHLTNGSNPNDSLGSTGTSHNNVNKELVQEREDFGTLQDDDASVLVIILQCETKSCDENITNLKWVFSDPYFVVQVCAVDPPPNVPTTKTLTAAQYQENYCMRKALTYAAEGPYVINSDGTIQPQYLWTKLPCIIVKDSSVSNITPPGRTDFPHTLPEDNIIGGMKRRISTALNKARQADLFYLCKWHDACNKYVDVNEVGSIDHGSTLKWSVQPTSTQAIMYTSSSRDFIREALVTATVPLGDLLNTNIAQGNLLATVFVPNIIDFDIDLATNNSDYAKLNECAPVTSTTSSESSASSAVWFGVIVLIVILVAWALIQIGPRYINSP
ncbi:Hypothetical protein HVR_LOCUS33 [uncultured virus]|nr:Hypothetical protein HVR_LOCUS33 [uncultured virus]